MAKEMGTQPLILICQSESDRKALEEYLKNRNPKSAKQVPQKMESSTFLLMNKFDDIWFWPLELTQNMFGAAAEQIYTFL